MRIPGDQIIQRIADHIVLERSDGNDTVRSQRILAVDVERIRLLIGQHRKMRTGYLYIQADPVPYEGTFRKRAMVHI